jgi:hypothetical protein
MKSASRFGKNDESSKKKVCRLREKHGGLLGASGIVAV